MDMTDMIVVVVLCAVLLMVGYQVTIRAWNDYEHYCDRKYGKGNWTTVEITGTEEAPRFYPGQSWKCVEIKLKKRVELR